VGEERGGEVGLQGLGVGEGRYGGEVEVSEDLGGGH